MTSRHDGVIA